MANRCLLSREESAFFFLLLPCHPHSLCPDSHGPAIPPSSAGRWKSTPVDENSRRTIFCIHETPLVATGTLHTDSIKGRYSPDPVLTSCLTRDDFLSRDGIHLSASYFPWESDSPQQRHEKRLINKLIRFLSLLQPHTS